MKTKLPFYQQKDVCVIARSLLGKILASNIDGQTVKGIIVETEAYSETERACHAFGGRVTGRTKTLFEMGGVAYVYLIYGMHHLVNVVTNISGIGEAVLIRALEPIENIELMRARRGGIDTKFNLTSGPGKLAQALGIDRSLDGVSLRSESLWIEEGLKQTNPGDIIQTTRIGVDYAGEDANLPWRYYVRANPWISKK